VTQTRQVLDAAPSPTRYTIALLGYAFTAIMIGTTMPTPMYATYAEQMDFTVFTTTVIYATYVVGVLTALLLFGRWSDAIGRRPMLLAGAAAALASAAVFLTADSIPVMLVARVLSGFSAGVFTGTATAAILEAAPPALRTRAAAIATVANMGGLGLGPLVAGVLVEYAPHPLHLSFIVHIVLVVLAVIAVLAAPETSARAGRIGVQRLSVPPQTRAVFVVASTAAFAGFAVTGLFAAVAPSFVHGILGIGNDAVAGATASVVFAGSAAAQLFAGRIPPARAVALGCAILVVAMLMLAVSLYAASMPGLIVSAVVAGAGQGISFSRGLAAVSERTPAERRGEVSSSYFVVAYVAISIPVIGVGLAAQNWGLKPAGVTFSLAVAVLAALCLVGVLWQERRQTEN
jgi:MFS family permease